MTLTFGSLFAGIGGIDLGLERAGMRCAWQVEKDEWCRRVLAKHWPDVPRHGDIRECGAANLAPVDVIGGGWPCQPFSVAGKRAGKSDDRFLWPEMVRVIAEVRPAFVCGENVPGLVSLQLDDCLSDLEALGYATWTVALPACAFDAPHRRERVFIIAHAAQCADERSLAQPSVGALARCDDEGAGIMANARSGRLSGAGEREVQQSRRAEVIGASVVADERRQQVERSGGLLDGERAARRNDADGRGGAALADAEREQRDGRGRARRRRAESPDGGRRQSESRLGRLADGLPSGMAGPFRWEPEPDVGRTAVGVKDRVNKLRGLGNAVVPQVAEWLGRLIIEANEVEAHESL